MEFRNDDCEHWKDHGWGAYAMLLTLDDGSAICDYCKKILNKDEQSKVYKENETLVDHVGLLMNDVEDARTIIERREDKIKRQARWITRLETSRTELRRVLREMHSAKKGR
jgi:hypothetical protein